MKDIIASVKKQIIQLSKNIVELEKAIAEKSEMKTKLTELLAIAGVAAPKKRGPKPKAKKAAVKAAPKKRGPKPKAKKAAVKAAPKKRGPKPKAKKAAVAKAAPKKRGRKASAAGTLPALIIDILTKASAPLKAKALTAMLQKKGWSTKSDDPQMMVYKTLHRIEKIGTVIKAKRGEFTVPR